MTLTVRADVEASDREHRWLAERSGAEIGTAEASERPDGRIFVRIETGDDEAFSALLSHGVATVDDTLHLTIRLGEDRRRRTAEELGFEPVLEGRSFDVPFESALRSLRGATCSSIHILTAADVDLDDLYRLDVELRRDVPGNDGWRGQREWFDDEMTSKEYDPGGYPVAIDPATGQLVGLCRVWRNEEGPRLGLVGVRRSHRSGRPAAALLRVALEAASTWGPATVEVHTAHPSLHRRLVRLGAQQTGGFTRLSRTP